MNRMSTGLVYFGLISIVLLVGFVASAPQCREHWYMTSVYWKKREPIQFYGRVVDQQGNPIADATVSIKINDFDMSSLLGSSNYMTARRTSRTSDANGAFSITDTRGIILFVESVSHPQFVKIPERDFEHQLHVGSFAYSRERRSYYVPDPQKPAIFPLRKEGEERVLWPSRGGRDEPNRR